MPQNTKKVKKDSLPRIKKPKMLDVNDETANQMEDSTSESATNEKQFSLYVRGAAWLKDRDNAANRLKEIEPRIQNVRHPRQKSADYCFIDFSTATERDQSFEALKNHPEVNVKPLIKDVPKQLEKRKRKVAEKREAKKETRKIIAQIKKKERLNAKPIEKTNQIVILNLPRQVTVLELKQKFSNAVKVNVKQINKGKVMQTAFITFPNPNDAFVASKESFLLHGQQINILLNTNQIFKRKAKGKKKNKRKASLTDDIEEPPTKLANIPVN